MRKAQGIRRRGFVLVFLGLLLVVMMGIITVLVAPIMLSAGASPGRAGFTGTQEQALLILGLFGLVIVFGVAAIGAGLWQIATGRRSIWVVIVILALAFLLIVVGSAVRAALGERTGGGTEVGSVAIVSPSSDDAITIPPSRC
jgi:membrane protease YdiL (CAAX protease family)